MSGKGGKDLILPPLPATAEEISRLGWDRPDIILVTGDAYVDHPSFGVALIGRYLQYLGFRVAALAQPDWRDVEAFRVFGPPRLFWGITSGCIDSRLNNYASLGHRRGGDVYSPAGQTGLRPDRPLLVYSARARQAYKNIPIILGGLEASLRRLTHYDFIEDKLKRSVLIDAKADMLVYGMAERAIEQIAKGLDAGKTIDELAAIPGTVCRAVRNIRIPPDAVTLASREQMESDKGLFLRAHLEYVKQCRPGGKAVAQEQGPGMIIVNPPASLLSQAQLDLLYSLPFSRTYHPMYKARGGVPALAPVQYSITTHRGCFGGCNFCSIYFHQGKTIQSRSIQSILDECDAIAGAKGFTGTITDIGGPTANMYGMRCEKTAGCGRASCLFPTICGHLRSDHRELLGLLSAILKWKEKQKRKINVFVASGIRHDLALASPEYINLLAAHFTGGHLKVAPEHICPNVLELMGKPPFELFEQFEEHFVRASKKAGKKQYLVPYFISSHPGCGCEDTLKLTEYLVDKNLRLRQVQDFIPLPLTTSAAMYVASASPKGKTIHIPKGQAEKRLQLSLLQYHDSRNIKAIADYLHSRKAEELLSRIRHIQATAKKNPDRGFE